jgi:pimeloyl-ACP methyl ester carboxylesterase
MYAQMKMPRNRSFVTESQGAPNATPLVPESPPCQPAGAPAYFGPLLSAPHRKALGNAYAVALERNPLLGIEKNLRRSTVPARIVWGMADPIFSAASPDYLDRTFGASRGVRRLEGRKLFFPEEVPDVIAGEALALWQGR